MAGKVPELKAELKLLGYYTIGKKAELILRLASAREEIGAILAHAGAHGMLFAPWPDPRRGKPCEWFVVCAAARV